MFVSATTTRPASSATYTSIVRLIVDGELRSASMTWSKLDAGKTSPLMLDGETVGEVVFGDNPTERSVENAMLTELSVLLYGMPRTLCDAVAVHSDLLATGRGGSPASREALAEIKSACASAHLAFDSRNLGLAGDRRYFAVDSEPTPEGVAVDDGAADPVAPATPRRIAVEFGSYNHRRYSKPWIARVTAWPVGGKATLEFGSYLGGDRGGEAEIQARPGDIVRWGQKDNRNPRHTEAHWGVVTDNGGIETLSETEARARYQSA